VVINWIKRRAQEHTSSRRFRRKSNKEANRWAHANKHAQAVYKVHSVSGHHAGNCHAWTVCVSQLSRRSTDDSTSSRLITFGRCNCGVRVACIAIRKLTSLHIGVDNRDYHHLSQNETNPGSKPVIGRKSCRKR
jgi:hypothetical protein